jgi:organic radical activating enzyme
MCGGANGQLKALGQATWHCDSEKVWKAGKDHTPSDILRNIEKAGELERVLRGSTHLILTGGEPLMHQNAKAIFHLMDSMFSWYPQAAPYFEVETAGTQYLMNPEDLGRFHQINCSPKLANSGMPRRMRIIPRALDAIAHHHNTWWKFVISEESDFEEFMEDYLPWISLDRVVLMPAGGSKEELALNNQVVWKLATTHNVRMTLRYQVEVWDKTTGV